MTKVVLQDSQFVAALDAIQQRSEICDSNGRVLGYYVPRSIGETVYYKGARSPFSEEELDRRYREGAATARPLAEFWEEMRRKHPDRFV